jgi:hypothetical protein
MKRPSQKIEFVFSASLEAIRREPREITLLRSVGKQQDLAVCALCNPVCFSLISGGSGRRAFVFCHHKVLLAAVHGQQIRDHLAGYREGRSIGVPLLLFLLIYVRELMMQAGRQLAASTSTLCMCLLRCLEIGVRLAMSAELFSAPHSPQ